MSRIENMQCDLCERIEEDLDKGLHIRKDAGWFARKTITIDICGECQQLIYDLNSRNWYVSESLKQIAKWYIPMGVADQEKFAEILKRTAKTIDRYADDHPKIYKAITKPSNGKEKGYKLKV